MLSLLSSETDAAKVGGFLLGLESAEVSSLYVKCRTLGKHTILLADNLFKRSEDLARLRAGVKRLLFLLIAFDQKAMHY